jgi:MoaA/NifB/PqqE/SkfB family radical SAM enzyme
MIISVNPSYFCNFRCEFCYLTDRQLGDTHKLNLKDLEHRLHEIVTYGETIDHIDLYGGEIGLLPEDYFNEMTEIFKRYTTSLNLVTNLSALNYITQHPDYTTSVSFDFEAREMSDQVFRNMALLNKPFSVLMLASPELLKLDVTDMIVHFNMLSNLQSVEIKPYSSNQANQLHVTDKDYEEFVKQWLTAEEPMRFEFVNKFHLDRVVSEQGHSFSDDHIYITPNGRFAVLEFDLNDNEYFKELLTLGQYWDWCEREKLRVHKNYYCKRCEYLGKCLSEHLRDVKSLDASCNGFKHLIDWYRNERV